LVWPHCWKKGEKKREVIRRLPARNIKFVISEKKKGKRRGERNRNLAAPFLTFPIRGGGGSRKVELRLPVFVS